MTAQQYIGSLDQAAPCVVRQWAMANYINQQQLCITAVNLAFDDYAPVANMLYILRGFDEQPLKQCTANGRCNHCGGK